MRINQQYLTAMSRVLAFALAITFPGLVIAQDNVQVGPREQAPRIELQTPPVPVKPPTDGKQVALVDLQLEFDKGKLRQARVTKTRRIASVAPKVFLRQGGDWEVRINGSEQTRFFVNSPAYLEAETEAGSPNPYTYVPQDGTVNWTLVVPLYRGDEKINARRIVILDRKSGEVILDSPL